ncbi:hypothetical protein AB4Z46_27465 [Variovorax sp. M-6]|uniref:hypothetical protein n=1 Tax=Variovorax sp. M-6 TaxID=3233041 RepID=UPI003F9A6236
MHPCLSRSLAAAGLVAALGVSGCGQHTVQAGPSPTRTEGEAEKLAVYIGDKFADAEAALARQPDEGPAAPSF